MTSFNPDLEAQYFEYSFDYNERTAIFYDHSEEGARKQYKELFGVPAGELLDRRNW